MIGLTLCLHPRKAKNHLLTEIYVIRLNVGPTDRTVPNCAIVTKKSHSTSVYTGLNYCSQRVRAACMQGKTEKIDTGVDIKQR